MHSTFDAAKVEIYTLRCDFLQIDRAGLHAPLHRSSRSLYHFHIFPPDALTDRNNSSSTIFREVEKELRSAFHISDCVCNAVQAASGGRGGRRDGEREEEREEGKTTRNKKSLKTGAIFVRPDGNRATTEGERRAAASRLPISSLRN